MARPLKVEREVYHVTGGGNRRACMYEDDGGRQMLLASLEGVVGRFGWFCSGYCLMSKHQRRRQIAAKRVDDRALSGLWVHDERDRRVSGASLRDRQPRTKII